VQRENLDRQFSGKVRERIEAREIRHLSVFALAPQPLLIELGRLLGDIVAADVRQLQREPQGWAWPADGPAIRYQVRKAGSGPGPVALVLALSATVTDERIFAALGPEAAIWAIEAERPHNDIMKRSVDLAEFRRQLRSMFKLVMAAAKTWRRLKGENQLPKVVQGVTFRNGVEVTNTPAQNVA
jgi:hypothetical protein